MKKQQARVAERLAYIDRTGRYPMDRLTDVALRLDTINDYRGAFAEHVARSTRALVPAVDLAAIAESILFAGRRAA